MPLLPSFAPPAILSRTIFTGHRLSSPRRRPHPPPRRLLLLSSTPPLPPPSLPSWDPGRVSARRQGRQGVATGRVVRQGYRDSSGRKRWRKDVILVQPRLRITGGSARGRRLRSPPVYVRPAMGKVREAVFSILSELRVLPPITASAPVRVLDLFCGAGTMGIEALSRGAHEAVFVDRSPECCACVQDNLSLLQLDAAHTSIVRETSAEAYLRTAPDGVMNVVALTPPYEEVDYGELMRLVAASAVIGERTLVVVEYPVEMGSMPPVIADRLIGLRNRRYGRTMLSMYACQPDSDWELRTEEFTIAGSKGSQARQAWARMARQQAAPETPLTER